MDHFRQSIETHRFKQEEGIELLNFLTLQNIVFK